VGLQVEEPPPAWGDRRAIEQVLTNLIDNAVKYTDEGGRIDVRVRDAGGRVEVEVADTGLGIPEAEIARVFERFYRVDKARSRALGGTGLGLAIVKHLLQAMGGDIRVDSKLGEGSRFTFWLPAAHDAEAGPSSTPRSS
jgi:two-component system phosphate regulon sensor histidine kinase PhoR